MRNTNSNSKRIDNPVRLSFDRPQFKTEGNTITCRLNYSIVNNPRYLTDDKGAFVSGIRVGDEKGAYRGYSATGVAICNSNDKFDKVTGRRIAQARAEAKAYIDARNALRNHREMLLRSLDETDAFLDKAATIIAHNKYFVREQGDNAESVA